MFDFWSVVFGFAIGLSCGLFYGAARVALLVAQLPPEMKEKMEESGALPKTPGRCNKPQCRGGHCSTEAPTVRGNKPL